MSDRQDERHGPDDFDDPDAPASAEELAASKRLRDALEGTAGGDAPPASPEVELALSLRAAWSPASLSADESHALLDAVPSAEEQVLAAQLRDALAAGGPPRASDPEDLHVVHALLAAFSPRAIDDAEHRGIVDAALSRMTAPRAVGALPARPRGVVVRVAFGVAAGGLALAASIVLVVTSAQRSGAEAPLAHARTTQPLFSEPFKPGEASARIDRIAAARASDFRNNKFSKWGVR